MAEVVTAKKISNPAQLSAALGHAELRTTGPFPDGTYRVVAPAIADGGRIERAIAALVDDPAWVDPATPPHPDTPIETARKQLGALRAKAASGQLSAKDQADAVAALVVALAPAEAGA